MIKIVKRKNDTKRRGIMTRILPGPLAERLLQWIEAERLRRHPRCTRESAPGARYRYCPPLFPKSPAPGRIGAPAGPRLAVTRQNVTNAVKDCIRMLGGDAQNFSGKSMRLGGLSRAINARVPEPILYLQSGHGKAKAARLHDTRRPLYTLRHGEGDPGGLMYNFFLPSEFSFLPTKCTFCPDPVFFFPALYVRKC